MASQSFWQWAESDPQRLALVSDDHRPISFGEFGARVNQLSRAFQSLGLQPDDGVAMVLNNVPEWIEVFMATQQVGLYLTPINYHLTSPEIGYIVENSEAKLFIYGDRYKDSAEKAMELIGFHKSAAYVVGEAGAVQPFASLYEGQSTAPPDERCAGQLMLYTSGTTGRPKGVRRARMEGATPEAAGMMTTMLGTLFDIKAGEGVHLVQGPLYHAAPSGFGTAAMHLGQALVLMDKWDAEGALQRIERYQVTATHMVPTMFNRLLDLPQQTRSAYDLSSLTNVIHAAAPCPPETKRKMFDWWGPIIYEYYGATEGGGSLVRPQEWLEHPGTVGRAWPGCELKILDDDGNELPPNQPGTIYMASMMGEFEYFKDKEKTKKATRGKMLTVGDVGYLDDDGWLFICDRKNDMIISGGVNIYPAEIEATLVQHPKIGDVAVFGIPDDDWGESVKAVVEPIAGIVPNDELAEEILEYAKENMAKYKIPRSIDFIEELPRLTTGKLYKRLLRDEYWQNKDKKI